jgi:hypothetical protein
MLNDVGRSFEQTSIASLPLYCMHNWKLDRTNRRQIRTERKQIFPEELLQ